jgi:hypothetical protein
MCGPDSTGRVGRILFTFGVESLSNQGLCVMNLNIPGTKTEALQMEPKSQNHDFVKMFNNFDNTSVVYSPYLWKNNGMCTMGPNEKCQFSQYYL